MHVLVLKFVAPNSNNGQLKKGLKTVKNKINPFVAWAMVCQKLPVSKHGFKHTIRKVLQKAVECTF